MTQANPSVLTINGGSSSIEHKQYIDKHGEDVPEIRDWKWGDST